MRRGRQLKTGGRLPSENRIIEVLESGDYRFTTIGERTKISKPTLSEALKNLEKSKTIKRYYHEGKILISLSDKEKDPVEMTLRHLAKTTHLDLLDLQKGRKILTGKTLEGVKEIAGFSLVRPNHEINTLNETCLLKSIARYYVERFFIPAFFQNPRLMAESHPTLGLCLSNLFPCDEGGFDSGKLQEFYEEEVGERGLFPALSIAKKRKIVSQLDDLVKWIRPILEPPQVAGKGRVEEIEDLVILSASNLAASLFRVQVRNYFYGLTAAWGGHFLGRSKEWWMEKWSEAIKQVSSSPKEGKIEEGGEKRE